jgi:TetR/AcrR family transcriptional regulator, regulator of cefoperazone and chloramphenicol sensitivity
VKNARAGNRQTAGRAVPKRIVEAAIACIERDGLSGVTIRGIAREAGVNSAAISYYFQSKEALVMEALATSLENAFGDWEALLRQRSPELRTRVRSVLLEVLEGSLRFPGIVKAHLYDTFIHGASRTLFIRRFARFLASLTRERGLAFPDRSARQIGNEVVQMVSAVLLPGIMPQLFRGEATTDLLRADMRAAYVDGLVGRFFP